MWRSPTSWTGLRAHSPGLPLSPVAPDPTARPGPPACSARLGSARLGSARLGSARLGSARLGSARLGSARLGSARLGSARLGSARLGSARLGSARLGSARRSVAPICSAATRRRCPSPQHSVAKQRSSGAAEPRPTPHPQAIRSTAPGRRITKRRKRKLHWTSPAGQPLHRCHQAQAPQPFHASKNHEKSNTHPPQQRNPHQQCEIARAQALPNAREVSIQVNSPTQSACAPPSHYP
ncbi:hypothetical protein ATK30_0610 [Amycolatopsis echigonensis]|uniref:Pentapeptide repeat protein n=1 Tax=Amycolatopsis echigonensis TaxID=2576905 RepID=A0A2N3X0I5_9PSEU|nr:hypothetical protein ATK30_0610 [Amycolatopsis niigatensis]